MKLKKINIVKAESLKSDGLDNQLIKGENVNFSYSKKEISDFIFKVRNLDNEPKMYVKKLLKTFYKF